jgi:hypothetical protein
LIKNINLERIGKKTIINGGNINEIILVFSGIKGWIKNIKVRKTCSRPPLVRCPNVPGCYNLR